MSSPQVLFVRVEAGTTDEVIGPQVMFAKVDRLVPVKVHVAFSPEEVGLTVVELLPVVPMEEVGPVTQGGVTLAVDALLLGIVHVIDADVSEADAKVVELLQAVEVVFQEGTLFMGQAPAAFADPGSPRRFFPLKIWSGQGVHWKVFIRVPSSQSLYWAWPVQSAAGWYCNKTLPLGSLYSLSFLSSTFFSSSGEYLWMKMGIWYGWSPSWNIFWRSGSIRLGTWSHLQSLDWASSTVFPLSLMGVMM